MTWSPIRSRSRGGVSTACRSTPSHGSTALLARSSRSTGARATGSRRWSRDSARSSPARGSGRRAGLRTTGHAALGHSASPHREALLLVHWEGLAPAARGARPRQSVARRSTSACTAPANGYAPGSGGSAMSDVIELLERANPIVLDRLGTLDEAASREPLFRVTTQQSDRDSRSRGGRSAYRSPSPWWCSLSRPLASAFGLDDWLLAHRRLVRSPDDPAALLRRAATAAVSWKAVRRAAGAADRQAAASGSSRNFTPRAGPPRRCTWPT